MLTWGAGGRLLIVTKDIEALRASSFKEDIEVLLFCLIMLLAYLIGLSIIITLET